MVDLNKILTYPFDCELLMRKQKAIRRNLLDRNTIYIKKRIALLGGSTITDIKNLLEIFLLQGGIQPEFYESEFNQYYEASVFSNTELDHFQPEIIFVFTSMLNLLYVPAINDSVVTVDQKLEAEYSRYEMIWTSLRRKYSAIVIQNNMEMPYTMPLGNFDAASSFGMVYFIEALNKKIALYAKKHSDFFIHDIHYLAAQIGLSVWHNRFQYYAYKFPVNYDIIPLVANNMAKMIKAILGKSKKCLVLDLDNTLWGGIIGDDGVIGLRLGHETPEAEAYTEFQQYVLELKRRGVILAVCSKNEADIAREGFDHPDSILSVDDFVAFKANWNPKNINIQEIARELNIGLDSLVFIDDNPVERQLVKDTLPAVAVPEVNPKDVFSYIRAIEGNGYFETVIISKDDLKRNETYLKNKKRLELQNKVSSYDDFLESLAMEAEIKSFKEVYFDRIAQLINKSNQFNLTTRRYTTANIANIAADEHYLTLYGRLRDKFGDNGLISVIIGEQRQDELHIILWLMSCRVLKRGMEQSMMDALVVVAQRRGIKKLVGYYYPTAKNKMVCAFYKDMGFKKIQEQDGADVWGLNLKQGYVKKNKFIAMEGFDE